MATGVRFRDEAGTTRLDLNSSTGFVLLRGLDLGAAPLEQTWLSQAPYDGATLASSHYGIRQITVPVLLTKQASIAAVEALMGALKTELQRDSNIFEFIPEGGTAHLFDTFRSPLPSLIRGQQNMSADRYLHDTEPMVLTIFAHPTERSGKHI